MEDNTTLLGKKVKELRLSLNLTQENVAEALNVTPGYVSNVENGRTAMSLRMLIFYARLTNVSLDYLVGNVDENYTATALDNDLSALVAKMSTEEKEKLIKTIKLWKN